MIQIFRSYLSGFISAWEMVIDISVPKWLKKLEDDKKIEIRYVIAGFPLLGFVSSLLILILTGLISIIFNKIAGGLFFVLFALFFTELKDNARGLLLSSSFFNGLFKYRNMQDALSSLSDRPNALNNPIETLMLALAGIIKIGLLFTLFYFGGKCWLIAILTASMSIQGYLATTEEYGEGIFPRLEQNDMTSFWVIIGTIFFITFLMYPMSIIITVILSYLFMQYLRNLKLKFSIRNNTYIITLAGVLIEWLLLFIGVMLSINI